MGDLRVGVPDSLPGALVGLRRLLRLDGGGRDRPLHRFRAADHPAAEGRRQVRARSLASRQVLQAGGLDRDRLDHLHLHRLHASVLPRRHPVQVELRLELAQLHAAAGLRRVRALRRLVSAVRAQVVQGADPAGRRGAARADRGGLRVTGGSGGLAGGPGLVLTQ